MKIQEIGLTLIKRKGKIGLTSLKSVAGTMMISKLSGGTNGILEKRGRRLAAMAVFQI